ncbi:MAG: serine/threonine protein kinase [Arenicellales bacterium]|nr:serine/threonine protein kinase [Arenicellales bacterium]
MSGTANNDYQNLGPVEVLEAVDSQGYRTDGRLLALNSYENRVYQVGLEDGDALVAKFYRPERWSDAAILEEHHFALELAAHEIPLVPPLNNNAGETLFHHGSYRFALFVCRGGRPPDFENAEHLRQLGRFIGRLHALGSEADYRERPALDATTFGQTPIRFLLENNFIPTELVPAYQSLAEDLLQRVKWCYERCGEPTLIRVHGDCHSGNILWIDDGPHLVDLDDSRMAPAVQDLWMFLAGEREEREASLAVLLEGYTRFADFEPAQLHLVEALRTLRMIHYYGWLAKRWDDPAFPRAFPWFNSQRCWEQHILYLREQAALMDEPPLTWRPDHW